MRQLRDRLNWAWQRVRENLRGAQQAQKDRYDWGIRPRSFQVGDQVLVHGKAFLGQAGDSWKGPFPIIQVVSPVTYRVQCGTRARAQKTLHVNLLKGWQEHRTMSCALSEDPTDLEDGEMPWTLTPQGADLPKLDPGLSADQKAGILEVLRRLLQNPRRDRRPGTRDPYRTGAGGQGHLEAHPPQAVGHRGPGN